MGCHDGYFLSLLRARGFSVCGCDPSAGAEIARSELSLDVRREFFRRGLYGTRAFDLFVARQVLEHVEHPAEFLAAAAELLRPGGLVALEVPDAELWLANGVLGSLFHEHVSYYTVPTLGGLVQAAGFELLALERCHTDLFLVARLGRSGPRAVAAQPEAAAASRELLWTYERRTLDKRRAVARVVDETRRAAGRVWLYGAGVHSSCLVAVLGLGGAEIDHVVDDNPGAVGRVLPGLPRPIAPASRLAEAAPRDVAIVSGFSFQEEMLDRLQRIGAPLRPLGLYPEVGFLDHATPVGAGRQGGAAWS